MELHKLETPARAPRLAAIKIIVPMEMLMNQSTVRANLGVAYNTLVPRFMRSQIDNKATLQLESLEPKLLRKTNI